MEKPNQNHACCNQVDCCETLAIATVPMQVFNDTYDTQRALRTGTIFPELDKPFFLGGTVDGR